MRYVLAILALTISSSAFAEDVPAPGTENVPADINQVATHAPAPLFRPVEHATVSTWPNTVPALRGQQVSLVEPRK